VTFIYALRNRIPNDEKIIRTLYGVYEAMVTLLKIVYSFISVASAKYCLILD